MDVYIFNLRLIPRWNYGLLIWFTDLGTIYSLQPTESNMMLIAMFLGWYWSRDRWPSFPEFTTASFSFDRRLFCKRRWWTLPDSDYLMNRRQFCSFTEIVSRRSWREDVTSIIGIVKTVNLLLTYFVLHHVTHNNKILRRRYQHEKKKRKYNLRYKFAFKIFIFALSNSKCFWFQAPTARRLQRWVKRKAEENVQWQFIVQEVIKNYIQY